SEYFGLLPDHYEWAEPQGNNLAFLVGDQWTDLFVMKSTDNGETWSKTVIWEHPYPMFDQNNPVPTDTFYCADGAHSIAFDNTGKIHIAFGITKAYAEGAATYYVKETDGVGYWNEDMASFSNNLNALNPLGGPGSEMIQDYNLIGWSQDINGNGTIDVFNDWGDYYLGMSSMPQLVIDDENQVFLFYSSVTEGYDNGIQNYRHIWARGSGDNGNTWGDFVDLNSDLVYIFSECIFPTCAARTTDKVHLIFMEDQEPGLAARGDMDPWGDNSIRFTNILKSDLINLPTTGTLSGTVENQLNGVPIQGALVEINGTAFSATTNASGFYTIDNIPAGSYIVTCSYAGYYNNTKTVVIGAGANTTQNFELQMVVYPSDEQIGLTYYDLQSNASMPNRIYRYPDGTIGATFTYGEDYMAFPDRGTGYNYFDGINWGPLPIDGIEPDRTGWPTYNPWGMEGEIIVSHYSGASEDGLIISSRPQKGTGNWGFQNFYGPQSNAHYLWPRSVTGGNNHSDLHVIALTAPTYNGGSVYQGMDGALLYSRSSDGGQTWDYEHVLLDGLNSDDYIGFSGDTYEIIARDNQVAFLVGDEWTGLVLMKSDDNGANWEKTVIWDHPYPMIDPSNSLTDTFYCVDGAHSLAFDNSGKVHVAFGIMRAKAEYASYIFPLVDGIGYWNEDMETFSSNLNALNPQGGPGSEMIQNYNLIGWMQDIDGNGSIEILDDFGTYYLGMSSMPQLVIDEYNNVFLFYSSLNEGYDNGIQNYRHIWARGSNDGGITWGNFIDINSDLVFIFSECVFPSCATLTDDNIHLIFMEDNEPGMAVRGDEDPYGINYIQYMSVPKSGFITINYGIFQGTVSDGDTGDPLEGATVEIEGTALTMMTGDNGQFFFPYVYPGNYEVICSLSGYATQYIDIEIEEGGTTNYNFELVPIGNLPPPTNLIGGVQGDDVLLVWNPPDTTGYNWLHWDNEENYDAVGLTSGGTFEIASRWEPSDLQPYDGYYLTKINFYLEEQPISVKLRVWTGENFSNLVVDQVVSSYFVQSWQTVTLDNPVLIDASEELCFGIEYNHEIGYLVAGIDGGPAIQEYGDMVNAGTGWSSLYVLTSGNLDGNWNLAGMVSTDPGGKSPAFTLLKEQKNSFNPDYSFSGKPCTKKTKSVKSTLDFLNYNIYRNSEFLATSQEPTYLDEDILPGEFSYYVTALYDDGESEPTNTFYIMAPYPCYPPESLQVNYIAPFIIEIIITGPSGGGPIIGYNLYRDGNYITSITGTTFWETNPLVGTYEYCVTTLCEDGESDPTCIEVIIEDPVLPPANLNAIVQDENILLEWTAPEYGSPDGYNIYYSFESSGFSMIAFVVDTAFTHLGAATLGLHEYYTTTVIDGEESEPSSTASVLIDITGKVLENNLRIFPNPATDKLYIKSDLNLISVKLLDMHGKEVSSSAPASIQYELNTTPFDNGLYLIQVITAEGAITKRIIIR
ncbi:MAG TPA: carboxypeptidase regulatory-like domain-containing protein, partial [Bacteroidales bacterium]|nr:carboxypeptidase regulatory-like domain-containing protein [Bacteroidales bacterium]